MTERIKDNLYYLMSLPYLKEKVETYLIISQAKSKENFSKEEMEDYNRIAKCLKQMEKYPNNPWWKSDDKRVLAYYQLNNPILLVDFLKFRHALEALLGRPVSSFEMGYRYEQLCEEANKKFFA